MQNAPHSVRSVLFWYNDKSGLRKLMFRDPFVVTGKNLPLVRRLEHRWGAYRFHCGNPFHSRFW